MPTLRSSVLIIGHPHPEMVTFGADFATTLEQASEKCMSFNYSVVVLPGDLQNAQQTLQFLHRISTQLPYSQRVLVQNETATDDLRQMVNQGRLFKILRRYGDSQFDTTIQEALEEHDLLQQNAQLMLLVNEQNERLKRLSAELEDRVERRQRFLEDARQKLLITNSRVEALHRALMAVHRATSVGEVETLVNEALNSALGLSWTRILFRGQGKMHAFMNAANADVLPLFAIFTAPLVRGRETLGEIHFAREATRAFSKDESGFLTQVAEAVALVIDRITKLEQSETLKHQWEDTFDAIHDPVAVIDDHYIVIRINQAYARQSGVEPERVIGRKCHDALFSKDSPCNGCKIGSNFRLPTEKTAGGKQVIYDVFSQPIQFKQNPHSLFVNMYHDISAQLRLERQILESAKMVELGTIGSSIAHELNNPLGGMLSFLQLIKMELTGNEPYFSDIDEMEKGARRCRDIVQNLLGFTRISSSDELQQIDLRQVVEQALNIIELRTRSMGITVTLDLPDTPALIQGQFNFLSTALRNFLQNAQEAIAQETRQHPGYQGEITVRVDERDSKYVIIITDNGVGIRPGESSKIYDPLYTTKDPINNAGLGLTVALQIITDQGGHVEVSAARPKGTTAEIAFPKNSNI